MNKFKILLLSLVSTFGYSQVYMNNPTGDESVPPPPGSGGGPITPGAPSSSVDMYVFLLLVFAVVLIVFITKYKLRHGGARN